MQSKVEKKNKIDVIEKSFAGQWETETIRPQLHLGGINSRIGKIDSDKQAFNADWKGFSRLSNQKKRNVVSRPIWKTHSI